MDILIKDIADVIVKITDGFTDETPDNIKQIVQDEVIRVTIDDASDRKLLLLIATIMDELEKEYFNQKGKGEFKLKTLLMEITKRYLNITDEMTFTQKVIRIATKLKEAYKDVK